MRADPAVQPEMASGCKHWSAADRPPLRVLVCGGLELDDQHAVFHALDLVLTRYRVTALIHGAARGADTLADQWAVVVDAKVPLDAYPRLIEIDAACMELDAFQRAHPDAVKAA